MIHSYDPGISPNTLFWTIPISPKSVKVDLDNATASLRLNNIALFDWRTIPNSLLRGTLAGPPACATMSLRIRWSGITKVDNVCDPTNHFQGSFIEDVATIQFTVREPGFSFTSDPANTSVNEFSEIGSERNGVFFTGCA
jgi:hypothetical protein